MAEADKSLRPARRARWLFQQAYLAQKNGRLERAIELYRRSIAEHATPEAYTYLGRSQALHGEREKAIESCRRALEIDPQHGAALNDLGVRLLELGRRSEAETWLRAATRAPGNRFHHEPYFHLGRLHDLQFDWETAKRCYQMAVRIRPDYRAARRALHLLRARSN